MKNIIFSGLKKFYRLLIMLMFFNLINSSISLSLPQLNGKLIDSLTNYGSFKTFFMYCMIIITLSIVQIILTYLSSVLSSKLNAKFSMDINYKVISHIQKASFQYLRNYDSAFVTEQINRDSNAIMQFVVNVFLNGTFKLLIFILSISALLSISIYLILVLIITIPIYIIIYFGFKSKIYNRNLEFMNQQSFLFSELFAQLQNTRSIKINSWFSFLESRFNSKFDIFTKKMQSSVSVNSLFSSINMAIICLSNLLILFICGFEFLNNKITIGDLVIATTYFNMCINSVQYFIDLSKDYQKVLVSKNRLHQHLDLATEINGTGLIETVEKIELINISYTISNNSIFTNLSYKFVKGEIYAIKGRNGAGKSTLLTIISGILDDYSGTIMYNDQSITELDMYSIRKNIVSYVEQHPYFIGQTLKDNLTLSNNNVTPDEMKKNLSYFDFNPHDKILDNTVDNLSGGERQKLAFLCAILKKPQILFLDEPTSMMDKISFEKFISFLSSIKKDMIIILVTHDEKLIKECDQVLNLDSGIPLLLSAK